LEDDEDCEKGVFDESMDGIATGDEESYWEVNVILLFVSQVGEMRYQG
jgi:hypothetical protein